MRHGAVLGSPGSRVKVKVIAPRARGLRALHRPNRRPLDSPVPSASRQEQDFKRQEFSEAISDPGVDVTADGRKLVGNVAFFNLSFLFYFTWEMLFNLTTKSFLFNLLKIP